MNNNAIEYASMILKGLMDRGCMVEIHKSAKEIEIKDKIDDRMFKYMTMFADKVETINSNDIIVDGFYAVYKVWHFGKITFKMVYTLRMM